MSTFKKINRDFFPSFENAIKKIATNDFVFGSEGNVYYYEMDKHFVCVQISPKAFLVGSNANESEKNDFISAALILIFALGNDSIIEKINNLKNSFDEKIANEVCEESFASCGGKMILNQEFAKISVKTLTQNHSKLFGSVKRAKLVDISEEIDIEEIKHDWNDIEKNMIPKIDLAKTYISKDIKNIARSMSKGTKSFIAFGEAGTGKSTAADIICKLINLPIKAIVNCTNELDQYVLGKWTPVGESFSFKESMVTDAIRNGGAVVFEEINFAENRRLSFLFSLLDENSQVELDNGEVVKVHKDFRFIATMNPSYSGTNELNKALKRRFDLKLQFNEVPKEQLHTMIDEIVGKEIAEDMIFVYNRVRASILADEREERMTPRYLLNWAKASKYSNIEAAATETFLGIAVQDMEFRATIQDLIDVKFASNTVFCKNPKITKMKGFSSKQKKLIPDKPDNVYIRDNKIVSIAKQLADGVATSAIFFGGTGTGKSTMARYICQDIGCPVIATVNCTESLDQYILGKWMPSEKGFFFKESAVTDAIKNGGAVIFEEINFGEPRFMSFFHSLMDNRKFVQLDNGEIVNVHPNFRIFATMNPGYEGTEMLNLALYDRFNIKLLVDELPLESIRPFVKINYNLDDEDFNFMAKIYLMVKNKIDAEQLDIAIAPDIIKHWAREYSYGCSLSEAAKITIAAIGFDDKEFNKYIDSLISYSIAKRK